MDTNAKKPHLAKSEIVEALPKACVDEAAAVAFLEAQRWGDAPCCPHCGVVNVYQMKDAKTGGRNADFRWRCRDCERYFTVRTKSVYEDSRLPLQVWCRAMWEMASSKNGCSALELKRKLQISYKSALFLAHRLRFAMADNPANPPKLTGTVEADEVFVGGKPRGKPWRHGQAVKPREKYTDKVPVMGMLQRGGKVRMRVIADVTAANVTRVLTENVAPSSRLVTDDAFRFRRVGKPFADHMRINHSAKVYVDPANPEITTNRIEGVFARVRRQLDGCYHSVSRKHLHRYMDHTAWLYNSRGLNDGERVLDLIQKANHKRLRYDELVNRAG